MFTRIALTASLAAATLFGAAQTASAQNRKQAIDIGIGPIWIEIGDGRPRPRPPRPGPRPERPRVVYVVTEYNPMTGGVYSARSFDKQADAYAHRDSIARVHWVKWRFVGINEPIRSRRFPSSESAQRFIDTNGPSKSGAAGFAILTNETRVVPGRVAVSSRQVQD